MASEMIERVARALEPKCAGFGPGDTPRLVALEFARAAIEAMREPTPQMEDAGMDANPRGRTISDADLLAIYRAMIDNALSEQEG